MSIEQKHNVKLLGILFDENLSWNDQINRMIKVSYGTLRAQRNFGRFTPYHVRKSLAEALVLSRLRALDTPNFSISDQLKWQFLHFKLINV